MNDLSIYPSPRPPTRSVRPRVVAALASTALAAGGLALATPSVSQAATPDGSTPQGVSSQVGAANGFSPQITHTGKGPTGYSVKFRYRDPSATRVQIKGEWYFSDPAQTTTTSSQGKLPKQWEPGDIPIAFPNSTAANWPVLDLKLNPNNGIWRITVPLPSGVFNYGFFVGCGSDTGAGCTEVSDPSNPPWNDINGTSYGSVESTSQVYVPSDSSFGTEDYSYQGPSDVHGNLVDVSYASDQTLNADGKQPLAVYTPPGYDPFRKPAYPTLYLSHGGGGNEVDWSTQGVAGNILDNMISSGQIPPMVVVMTNFNNLKPGTDTYAQDLLNNVIPYVESNYRVLTSPNKRAFAGLSLGGRQANNLLFNHTRSFAAYSVMSNAGGFPTTVTALQKRQLKQVQIQISGGVQDPLRPLTVNEETLLTSAGIPFVDDSINGGHEWYVWRILLHDFLLSQPLGSPSD